MGFRSAGMSDLLHLVDYAIHLGKPADSGLVVRKLSVLAEASLPDLPTWPSDHAVRPMVSVKGSPSVSFHVFVVSNHGQQRLEGSGEWLPRIDKVFRPRAPLRDNLQGVRVQQFGHGKFTGELASKRALHFS